MADTLATTRRLTRADYQALPEGPPYYELIDGELIEMTRARRPHYRLTLRLGRWWDEQVESEFGGELALEPNLYLPGIDDVYHPDLVYVAEANLAICEDDGIWGTPDVIVEVLSPSTERIDRHKKLESFRLAGVPHVWLISPQIPVAVEEYSLEPDCRYRLNTVAQSPDEFTPVAFPGWRIPLAQLDAAIRRAGRGTASAAPQSQTKE